MSVMIASIRKRRNACMLVTLVTILFLSVHGTRTKAIVPLENFRVLILTLHGTAAYLGHS
jgi:hypothetical protein